MAVSKEHSATTGGILFIILAQAPIASPATEGLFDDPAARRHRETDLILGLAEDLDGPTESGLHPVFPVLSGKTRIRADPRDRLAPGRRLEAFQQAPRAGPFAGVGGQHDAFQQVARDVAGRKPLATVHLLAAVKPARPPFSVVLALWLSMTATVGYAPRPWIWRTCGCNAWSTWSHTPPRRPRQKHEYTVFQCRYSRGK